MSSLSLVTPPVSEPIDLETAKGQCRVDLADDDPLIQGYITAAREYVEHYTGRQLITATWQLVLDGFPCWIDVPKAPLKRVTSITYVDTAGVTQTLASSGYKVLGSYGLGIANPTAGRGRIERAYASYWPITRCESGSVAIEFEAGYGDAQDVPQALKLAQLLLIGHWYENRQQVLVGSMTATPLPFAVDALLGPYRTWPVAA
jgi:uncharacterized phiE125 gp8 family phage protein